MPTEFLKRYGRDMKAAMGCDVAPPAVRRTEYLNPAPRPVRAPVPIGRLIGDFVDNVVPHPQRNEIARRLFNTDNKL